jgi:DNA polymerase I-like protein with 3'-5' exonuclease and polymerase domains
MPFIVIDFETGPYNPELKTQTHAYGLEPYREEFFLKSLAWTDGQISNYIDQATPMFHDCIKDLLEVLQGKEVYAHNAGFDIMCCLSIADKELVRGVKWRDSALLCKWVENGQETEYNEYSLAACVSRWCPEEIDFLNMKDNAVNSDAYWANRAKEDVRVTYKLVQGLLARLPVVQYRGYAIEQATLVPFAEATMQGILLDVDTIEVMQLEYNAEISKRCRLAGIKETMIASPDQLGRYLFEFLGLTPISYTKSGKPSTAAGDIKRLILQYAENVPVLKEIQAIKQLMTVRNKYAKAFVECVNYGGGKLRPRIKLFNSYTGRATYSSKLAKKFPVAIALHQLPRKFKAVKRVMIAPPGYRILYADFASVEVRIIAEKSRDQTMVEAINTGKDLHAIMAEGIFGTPYDTIVAGKDTDELIKTQRDGGKMLNLSSQYRIGAKTFVDKAFEQYDKILTLREAQHYLASYKRTFSGVPQYWKSAIQFAHAKRHAESFSQRRFYIDNLDWNGEQSAINMPIQGSSADLMEFAVAAIAAKFPSLIFQVTVHDSLTWLIPDSLDPILVKDYANSLNYKLVYGIDFAVNFPMDFAIGPNFADLTSL